MRYGELEHSLLIPSSLFLLASQARDALLLSLPSPSPEVPGDGEPCSETELVALFLGKLAALTSDEPGAYEELLSTVITEFERSFLKGNEIHAVASTLPGDLANRTTVIQSYYAARLTSGKSIKGHESALFRGVATGDTKIFSVFGGQGNMEEYFDELRGLVEVYDRLATEFV